MDANVTIRVHCATLLEPGTPIRAAYSVHALNCVHVAAVTENVHQLIGITVGRCVRNPALPKGYFVAASVMGPTLMVAQGGECKLGARVPVGDRQLLVLCAADDEVSGMVQVLV